MAMTRFVPRLLDPKLLPCTPLGQSPAFPRLQHHSSIQTYQQAESGHVLYLLLLARHTLCHRTTCQNHHPILGVESMREHRKCLRQPPVTRCHLDLRPRTARRHSSWNVMRLQNLPRIPVGNHCCPRHCPRHPQILLRSAHHRIQRLQPLAGPGCRSRGRQAHQKPQSKRSPDNQDRLQLGTAWTGRGARR